MPDADVVIVGAGSAGAVLANRLSADPDRSVLLLEAGPDWQPEQAPDVLRSFDFLRVVRDGRFIWSDIEARQTPTQERGPFFVGRGLGGGSTANGMVWTRPPLADFDRWAALGCDGWAGEDVLPFFNRSEADELGDHDHHGADGPIPVWRPPEDEWGAVDRALREAAAEHGHPEAADLDFNGPDDPGLATAPFNVRDGERVSTNDAYLQPVRSRENLSVRTGALVDRVQFEDGRATGVNAVVDGERRTIGSDRVVLAAGAIHTPAILMRSGIGPPAALAEHDIDVQVSHDGVGRLVDHPLLTIAFPLEPGSRVPDSERPAGSLFLRWGSGHPAGDEADLYAMAQNVCRTAAAQTAEGAILLGLTSPHSTGRVSLASDDPTTLPDIEVGLLADRRDRARFRRGIRHVEALLDTAPFAAIRDGEPVLGPSVEAGRPLDSVSSDEALTEAMLTHVTNYSHPVGTARMGAPADPSTVVDPDGAVVGVDELYVADASLMPTIVRANTNATAVMIGERLSSVFIERW